MSIDQIIDGGAVTSKKKKKTAPKKKYQHMKEMKKDLKDALRVDKPLRFAYIVVNLLLLMIVILNYV